MTAVHPGATIGIIGGGQLARMLAFDARRMGYRVAVLDPDVNSPASQVADLHVTGRIDDLEAGRVLAAGSDVVTIDSEHVPADLLQDLENQTRVRPGAHVLREVQDRLRQRRLLDALALPQPKYAVVSSDGEIEAAASIVRFPAVLKTRREGYDGKGQSRVESIPELRDAWNRLGQKPCVLEAFVPFEKEISVILARGLTGEVRFYPVAENRHRRHILHVSHAPASITADVARQAEWIGGRIAAAIEHVGMLAVELFVTHDQQLLVNEIAPRTHNSGHYTLGACVTSQFEQHVRAICGLPLGDSILLRPAVMLNLLGDLWDDDGPPWDALVASPGARLHVYGKAKATAGRKMGHVLVLDETLERALATSRRIELDLAALHTLPETPAPVESVRSWRRAAAPGGPETRRCR